MNGTPYAQNIQTDQFQVVFNQNERGTLYYTVLPDGSGYPADVATIKAGTTPGQIASNALNIHAANVNLQFNVTGLTQTTNYEVYLLGEDQSNNSAAIPEVVYVTTIAPDVTPPTLTVSSIGTPDHEAFNVDITTDEDATLYVVILTDNTNPPTTLTHFQNGTDGLGGASYQNFSYNNVSSGTDNLECI